MKEYIGVKRVSDERSTNRELEIALDSYCGAVASTMGPGGRTVIINRGGDVPVVTKDGVTVSESIFYENPLIQDYVELLKEAARKTAKDVGDGTTTSTVLAKSFIRNMYEFNASELESFEELVDRLLEVLNEITIPVNGNMELLKAIVDISSNGDKEMTDLIMEAVEVAGADGLIDVEMVEESISNVKVAGGSQINSLAHVRDVHELMNPIVLLNEGAVKSGAEIKNIIKLAFAKKQPVVLIAKEFSKEVIAIADKNRARKAGADLYLVEAEGFGDNRLHILEDLAQITGTRVYSTDGSTVLPLSEAHLDPQTEYITKAVVRKDETILLPNYDVKTTFAEKIEQLIASKSHPDAPYGIEAMVKRRLTKFSTTAVIRVGGITRAATEEKKDRVDDAVRAVAAAVTGGVLPGGGVTIPRVGNAITKGLKGNYVNRFIEVCNAPRTQLLANMGLDILPTKGNIESTQTHNLRTMDEVDAVKFGIVDPALVTIHALQNAFAVAKTVVNSKYYVYANGLQSERSDDY